MIPVGRVITTVAGGGLEWGDGAINVAGLSSPSGICRYGDALYLWIRTDTCVASRSQLPNTEPHFVKVYRLF